jgi:hypothetical protein
MACKSIRLDSASDMVKMLAYCLDKKHPRHKNVIIDDLVQHNISPPPDPPTLLLSAAARKPKRNPPKSQGRSLIYRTPDGANLTACEKKQMADAFVNAITRGRLEAYSIWHFDVERGSNDLHIIFPSLDREGNAADWNPVRIKAVENATLELINLGRDKKSKIKSVKEVKNDRSTNNLFERLLVFKSLTKSNLIDRVMELGVQVTRRSGDNWFSVGLGGRSKRLDVDSVLRSVKDLAIEREISKPSKRDVDYSY